MNRRIGLAAAALPVLATAALLASCRDSAEPEEINVAGFWDLWSLDGQAMPVSVDIVTITSGSLDLRGNGTYAFALTGVLLGEPWGDTESGAWTRNGNTVTLTPNDGCANTAVLEERDILKVGSHCAEGWELVLVR